ncbi:MAG: hypothetical protein R2722_14325 [Tessaracoccus sp.]
MTLPPGSSIEVTSPAATGSVTDANTIGRSVMLLASAWAGGVAIATKKSRSLDA